MHPVTWRAWRVHEILEIHRKIYQYIPPHVSHEQMFTLWAMLHVQQRRPVPLPGRLGRVVACRAVAYPQARPLHGRQGQENTGMDLRRGSSHAQVCVPARSGLRNLSITALGVPGLSRRRLCPRVLRGGPARASREGVNTAVPPRVEGVGTRRSILETGDVEDDQVRGAEAWVDRPALRTSQSRRRLNAC